MVPDNNAWKRPRAPIWYARTYVYFRDVWKFRDTRGKSGLVSWDFIRATQRDVSRARDPLRSWSFVFSLFLLSPFFTTAATEKNGRKEREKERNTGSKRGLRLCSCVLMREPRQPSYSVTGTAVRVTFHPLTIDTRQFPDLIIRVTRPRRRGQTRRRLTLHGNGAKDSWKRVRVLYRGYRLRASVVD